MGRCCKKSVKIAIEKGRTYTHDLRIFSLCAKPCDAHFFQLDINYRKIVAANETKKLEKYAKKSLSDGIRSVIYIDDFTAVKKIMLKTKSDTCR